MLVDVEECARPSIGPRGASVRAIPTRRRGVDDEDSGAATHPKRVMASALQVHAVASASPGEHDLHFFFEAPRKLDQLAFGDASAHRERLAALLRPRVEAVSSVV